jgi:hypothetical protein
MARTARTVKPALSDEPADKLAAALSYPIGKWKRRSDATYTAAPFYYDQCWEWFQRLSANDHETVLTLADVMGSAHKGAAGSIAESLPPAPKRPL